MVECLSKELAVVAPGIRVFMPEPGLFRTPVLSKLTYKPSRLDAYMQLDAETFNAVKTADGKQPGDPVKGVKHLIDLIQDASIEGSRNLPLRMPLGTDAFDIIKQKCEDTLTIIEDWEHTGKVTDL
jgi:NAD(P)-dependent dehydrogenase (short-subunit alcohol dehydrogenase family)